MAGPATRATGWTNPSVLKLAARRDPVEAIVVAARGQILDAQEQGWTGPPFDPVALADLLGIGVRAREGVEDARLISVQGKPWIEFNPSRPRRRIRFSVAHEIGHWLFPDAPERIRYRSHAQRSRPDDWQIESLCNLAAAEILVPVGSFSQLEDVDLDLNRLLDIQREFDVSIEALLLRLVKLSGRAVAVFCARRDPEDERYRIAYVVGSRAWAPSIGRGTALPKGSFVEQCTAIGFSAVGDETWADESVHVQAVGTWPLPHESDPRVVGLVSPEKETSPLDLRYVRGDVSDLRGDGNRIIVHVVNDRSRSWQGARLSSTLAAKYPEAHQEYVSWVASGKRALGATHLAPAEEQLWICSLVAQAGYGKSKKPRLRYPALESALHQLADSARSLNASLHMPLLGTGQGRGDWSLIKALIYVAFGDLVGVTTVYVLPEATLPDESARQMSLID